MCVLLPCHKGLGAGTFNFLSVLNGMAKYSTLSNSKRNAADMGLAFGGNCCSRGWGFNYLDSS